MSRKRVKQYLMLLTVVGLVAVAANGAGTFASFSATTTNDGNTFATGTLFLQNSDGTTTCNSETNSTNVQVTGCAILFDDIPLESGVVTSSQPLTLTNTGTVDASSIDFSVSPACNVTDNQTGTGSSVTFGTAPACSEFQLAIQEVDAANSNANVSCAFGTDTSGACSFPSGKTFANSGSPAALSIANTTGTNASGELDAGKSRSFVIQVKPVLVGSDNTLQNRKVSFGLTWTINQ